MKTRHPPPTLPRLNLTSPYDTANNGSRNYTKDELDMRRKAEVLKHQGPQKSTQMNTLTKKQKFAQIVRGYNPAQKALKSKRYTPEQISFCNSSNNRTLSSSSDVPGIPILLYMDPAIPLYNYSNEHKTYSDLPRPNGEILPWRFFANDQATSIGVAETNIGTLEILKDIASEVTTFSIDIPVATLPSEILLTIKYAGQVISYINPDFSFTYSPSNIKISNIQLYTVDGYFYEFFVTSVSDVSITGGYITLT